MVLYNLCQYPMKNSYLVLSGICLLCLFSYQDSHYNYCFQKLSVLKRYFDPYAFYLFIWLKQQKFIFITVLEKSKIRISSGFVSPSALLLGFQVAVFSLSSHGLHSADLYALQALVFVFIFQDCPYKLPKILLP